VTPPAPGSEVARLAGLSMEYCGQTRTRLLSHLRDISARHGNVVIGIITDGTEVDIPPLHGFTLYDDKLIVIDAYNTGLTTRGRADLEIYRRVFDDFQERATTDIEPVLAKYEELYVDQLRSQSRDRAS